MKHSVVSNKVVDDIWLSNHYIGDSPLYDVNSKPSTDGNYLVLSFYQTSENRLFKKLLFTISLNRVELSSLSDMMRDFLVNSSYSKTYSFSNYGYMKFGRFDNTNNVVFEVNINSCNFSVVVDVLYFMRFIRLP